MIAIFRDAMGLLEPVERRNVWLLIVLSGFAAVVQTLAILAIMPFIVLLANPGILASNELFQAAYRLAGAQSYQGFLAIFGAFSIVILTVGNLFLAVEHWLSHRFLCLLGHRLEKLVMRRMLAQTYEQHVGQHTARLSDVVLSQVERLVDGVIGAVVVAVSNAALTVFVVLMLLVVSFKPTVVTLLVLFAAYVCIFWLLKRRIAHHGAMLTNLSGNIFTHVREMLNGIREIKVRKAEEYFARRFESASLDISRLAVRHGLLSFLPGFILETLVFAGLVGVTLFFIMTTQNAGATLSYVALYGMATYRLVPALKSVFDGVSTVYHNADAVRIVRQHCSKAERTVPQRVVAEAKSAIRLASVSYAYPGSEITQLDDVSLSIPVGSSVCLFGPSGSGKTTVLNILVGLLYPQSGNVFSDDVVLGAETRDAWRARIGYCPQDVFLFDDSVASNIAFGVPQECIDHERVEAVARQAQLGEFLNDAGRGLVKSVVGEDGKTLSGGQRQRIGIARALYHDPSIVVLDESFSGLDAANRDAILDELFALDGKTLVFSSHEPLIAARCDRVAAVEQGRLTEVGRYEDLVAGTPDADRPVPGRSEPRRLNR